MHANRLLILQQREDYRELVTSRRVRFRPEAMYALEAMTTWGLQMSEVGVMACQSNQPYNDVLETGVRAIGTGLSAAEASPERILKLVADFCPTHLVIQVPQPDYFRWAIQNRIRTVALFEHDHSVQGPIAEPPLQRWTRYRLAKLLNHDRVDWVASQGQAGCQSLRAAGILPEKIISWGWPQPVPASEFEPKQLRPALALPQTDLQLVYQGPITSVRGFGDLLVAIAHLRSKGRSVRLQAIGQGDTKRFWSQARRLQIADRIEFIETSFSSDRRHHIRSADILVAPSRHDSPETSPSAVYDALTVCTPVVASDHPLFLSVLHHGISAMIFPAGNARALVHRIERLLSQPQLYAQLSEAGRRASETAPPFVTWAAFLNRWLQNGSEDRQWLQQRSLSAQPLAPLPATANPTRLNAMTTA